jgi:prepilin-type N-terminal cleavage/methylation domain-containing protein
MIKKIRSSKAFTLIEMLIVVAIIGILVGVGVPALRNARADAQARKAESVLANVATAKARYELDNNLAGLTSFNSGDNDARFALIAPYLLVNGTQPTTIAQLVNGTGYTSVNINAVATYDANGQQTAAAVAPDYATLTLQ